ncbi:hypothetical protein [Flavobacterium quisquiliarum]|uniref:Uncharacterized protein n=1 Tax=Flavobacterium quisquiliarum TaxID=1834436 RepID=A0ABV8W9M5_9FLAO|nr:hypothetical protein [Flavobacterium quisquiliarum]MBW1655243.1 hypothetical protein [Flavobacterium quisquiliarum]NWL00629.1 hypothetical protein [Flavobacterium collinsii]
MKTLFTLGACALLSLTIFSCTAEEFETEAKKSEIQKVIPSNVQAIETGPGDDPVNLPPPPPPKK